MQQNVNIFSCPWSQGKTSIHSGLEESRSKNTTKYHAQHHTSQHLKQGKNICTQKLAQVFYVSDTVVHVRNTSHVCCKTCNRSRVARIQRGRRIEKTSQKRKMNGTRKGIQYADSGVCAHFVHCREWNTQGNTQTPWKGGCNHGMRSHSHMASRVRTWRAKLKLR